MKIENKSNLDITPITELLEDFYPFAKRDLDLKRIL